MDDALELVTLNDGQTYSDAEGADVFRFTDPEVARKVTEGEYEDADDIPPLAFDRLSIKGLLGVFSRAYTLAYITEGKMDPADAVNPDCEAAVALRRLNEAVSDLMSGREVIRG